MGCVAVIFGLLAFWIAWIAATCLDGSSWFDFVVRMVLQEVILAVGLLALILLVQAVCALPLFDRFFEKVAAHTAQAAAIFFAILIAPWLLFAVGWAAFSAFGLVP